MMVPIHALQWYRFADTVNTSGMLLKSVNLYQQAGAGYELVMDFGNLPRGEYVLYIKVNDQKFSEKVSVE